MWGLDARASTATPAGEIDVIFAHGEQRYIAEAKWERSKTDAGPLAKLGLRLRQRMRGAVGVRDLARRRVLVPRCCTLTV
jgi:Holliday junction resolvase-like predicted endonuclease